MQSARKQLDAAGFAPIQTVIVSHGHWDHASGVEDFPEAKIYASEGEMPTIVQPKSGAGGAWPSQVAVPGTRWVPLVFKPIVHKGYAQSLDLFNDGSVEQVRAVAKQYSSMVVVPAHDAAVQGALGYFLKWVR